MNTFFFNNQKNLRKKKSLNLVEIGRATLNLRMDSFRVLAEVSISTCGVKLCGINTCPNITQFKVKYNIKDGDLQG